MSVSKHPRLGIKNSLYILNALSSISVRDPLFARIASVPLLVILKRFGSEKQIQDFVERFCSETLEEALFNNEASPSSAEVEATSAGGDCLKKAMAFEVMFKMLYLKNGAMNSISHEILTKMKQRFQSEYGYDDDGIMKLLRLLEMEKNDLDIESGEPEAFSTDLVWKQAIQKINPEEKTYCAENNVSRIICFFFFAIPGE